MALLFSLEGSTELTLEFSGLAVDLLSVDSIEGHNRVSGKGFPTTGPRVEAGNVVIHRGLHCALLICASFGSTRLVCASFGSTRLICASFGSTRLMCASFGSTRLICATFGSTRLICASFGSTRLICAFYGTTRLLCRVRARRGADRRKAGRTREGHMDASGFLIASAMARNCLFVMILMLLMNRNWSVLNFMSNGRVLVFGSDLSLVRKVGSLQLSYILTYQFLKKASYNDKLQHNHINLLHLDILNNEEIFKGYPWGRLSYILTYQFLKKASYNDKDVVYLQGFPLALVYWALEKIPRFSNLDVGFGRKLAIEGPPIVTWECLKTSD
ncbi:DNA-directed RNA polymerase I subunit RPA1-like [Cucumis melo var. makuwa]|uniref:DNA-directed RNA polymerase I subunit RPA1-like n=1 Tax=Cucumis melo var. makuwa TaxID=1194695 RepID=A0A5A7T9I0_CUCMM|nr:DNA-directed RNA polymerase I subunit RPA1-like [Cucumis melo var. makuwa]